MIAEKTFQGSEKNMLVINNIIELSYIWQLGTSELTLSKHHFEFAIIILLNIVLLE